jgi:hypothetical protein
MTHLSLMNHLSHMNHLVGLLYGQTRNERIRLIKEDEDGIIWLSIPDYNNFGLDESLSIIVIEVKRAIDLDLCVNCMRRSDVPDVVGVVPLQAKLATWYLRLELGHGEALDGQNSVAKQQTTIILMDMLNTLPKDLCEVVSSYRNPMNWRNRLRMSFRAGDDNDLDIDDGKVQTVLSQTDCDLPLIRRALRKTGNIVDAIIALR